MMEVSGSRLRRRRGMGRKSFGASAGQGRGVSGTSGAAAGQERGARAAGHGTGLGKFLSKSPPLFIEWGRSRKTYSPSPVDAPVDARCHF